MDSPENSSAAPPRKENHQVQDPQIKKKVLHIPARIFRVVDPSDFRSSVLQLTGLDNTTSNDMGRTFMREGSSMSSFPGMRQKQGILSPSPEKMQSMSSLFDNDDDGRAVMKSPPVSGYSSSDPCNFTSHPQENINFGFEGRPSSIACITQQQQQQRHGIVNISYAGGDGYSGDSNFFNIASRIYLANPIEINLDVEYLKCLVYCGIFPDNYEIDKDTLIQLWMAAGFFIDEPLDKLTADLSSGKMCDEKKTTVSCLEPIAYAYEHYSTVDKLISISFAREDFALGKVWYKKNRTVKGVEVVNAISYNEREPCHVTVLPQSDFVDLEVLKRLTEMRTLLFLRDHGCCFDRMPYDFFISLKHLETLDLSETRLLELPSSIGNANCLRYLDLSGTLIKQLPNTIDRLHHLQTLKLHKCNRLVALPKGMRKLTSLRYLEFDTPCRFRSMPPGMGTLTALRTLSEFPVGAGYGCTVQELKNMNSLRKRFCLSRLENVASSDEAKEANLSNKQWLKEVELRWSQNKHRNPRRDNEVIEYLRPHLRLKELRICCYGGHTFPSWISDSCFVNLESITLFKCENCQLLPSLGQLPSLKFLTLYEMTGVRIIDFHSSQDRAITDVNDIAFPKLQKLEITSMLHLEEMRDLRGRDFPYLVEITVKDCPKLVALLRLFGAPSLKHLEINNCPMLPSLPGGGLSIETLVIEGCALLTSSCLEENGEDWHKTLHVPIVFIDQIQIPRDP